MTRRTIPPGLRKAPGAIVNPPPNANTRAVTDPNAWPQECVMSLAIRFFASVLIAACSVAPLAAADVTATVEPPAPNFFIHAGALGVLPSPGAQATGGGLFPISNIAIRPNYTLGLDAGYFLSLIHI